MICQVLGCSRPARGDVETLQIVQIAFDREVTVPAHFCRFCVYHECELERYLLTRQQR